MVAPDDVRRTRTVAPAAVDLPEIVQAPADASALVPDVPSVPVARAPEVLPDVTRVEIELGSGTIRRGSLLGAVATVERHGARGWVPLPGALVRLTFAPLGGGDPVRSSAVTDERGRARFAARHEASGTWSASVESAAGTPCSTARLVVVHD